MKGRRKCWRNSQSVRRDDVIRRRMYQCLSSALFNCAVEAHDKNVEQCREAH